MAQVTSLGNLINNTSGIGKDITNIYGTGITLGGGIRGIMPRPVVLHDNADSFAQTRFLLKDAWNTDYIRQLGSNKRIITPFRAVNNSGDILSRKNYSCGGSCQTFQSRPGMHGLKGLFGAIQSRCDGSGVPPASCNVKYVYDGSDYTTYLRQRAMNKNFNDRSFGGDDSSAAQVAMKSIKRF